MKSWNELNEASSFNQNHFESTKKSVETDLRYRFISYNFRRRKKLHFSKSSPNWSKWSFSKNRDTYVGAGRTSHWRLQEVAFNSSNNTECTTNNCCLAIATFRDRHLGRYKLVPSVAMQLLNRRTLVDATVWPDLVVFQSYWWHGFWVFLSDHSAHHDWPITVNQ